MSGVPNLEAEILVSGVEELGGWQPWPVTLRGCPSQSGAVPLPSPPHDSASSLSQTSWGRGGALKRRRCSWRGRSRGLWPADVTPGWGPGRAGNLLPTQRPALQRQSCRDRSALQKLYSIIIITFWISSVKFLWDLFSFLLSKYLLNIFDFISWSEKPKIFTICSFTYNVCWLLIWGKKQERLYLNENSIAPLWWHSGWNLKMQLTHQASSWISFCCTTMIHVHTSRTVQF